MDANAVLDKNYEGAEHSFLYDLYERGVFCVETFWEYYDSIDALARERLEQGMKCAVVVKIAATYQRVMQAFLEHMDQEDPTSIIGFPKNYPAYLERLEGAVDAYYRGAAGIRSGFSLQR